MKATFVVCAVSAIVDEATKNISITSILERLTSPTFPGAVPLTLVAHFNKEVSQADNFPIRVRLRIGTQTLMDQPVTIQFQGKQTTRLIAGVSPLVIPQPGELTADVLYRGKVIGAWTINVEKAGDELLLAGPTGPPSPPPAGQHPARKTGKKAAKKAAKKK